MLTIVHRPELVTPALRAWLRPCIHYDDDGRSSRWLAHHPLPRILWEVTQAIAPDVAFASVLLQAYRDGSAVTPCHSDEGVTGFSFSLSIGAPRFFCIHRVGEQPCMAIGSVNIEVIEGTILEMSTAFQKYWHHQIIASPEVKEEKLTLVFRTRPGG